MYRVGMKVQAIDELGRCEMGRNIQISEENATPTVDEYECTTNSDMITETSSPSSDPKFEFKYKIRFQGWSQDFDLEVCPEELRLPMAVDTVSCGKTFYFDLLPMCYTTFAALAIIACIDWSIGIRPFF
jgi:hypothetical protein